MPDPTLISPASRGKKPVQIGVLRALAIEAVHLDQVYSNASGAEERAALTELENAEQRLVDYSRYPDAIVSLVSTLDAAIAIADKASGAIHKDEPYEIGKAKREVAADIARQIRQLVS